MLSEHIAWRYVFERLAIVIEHTFQDLAQFHRGTPTICYTGVIVFAFRVEFYSNSTRFSSMNTLTLKDLPDNLASSGNSLLSMIMQLSMSIGVTIAGLLLGLFGSQHVSVDSGTTQTVFMYTWLSMAFIIALPAFIFARVPNDTHQNVAISRRKRSAQ